mmetsp:Transcript_125918/g.337835  ORF Transcript_125918/g.337835 Transcript_125918/m.337835 type:complete len:272 (-) Transcript_125918:497-1312(-)
MLPVSLSRTVSSSSQGGAGGGVPSAGGSPPASSRPRTPARKPKRTAEKSGSRTNARRIEGQASSGAGAQAAGAASCSYRNARLPDAVVCCSLAASLRACAGCAVQLGSGAVRARSSTGGYSAPGSAKWYGEMPLMRSQVALSSGSPYSSIANIGGLPATGGPASPSRRSAPRSSSGASHTAAPKSRAPRRSSKPQASRPPGPIPQSASLAGDVTPLATRCRATASRSWKDLSRSPRRAALCQAGPSSPPPRTPASTRAPPRASHFSRSAAE